MGSMSEHFVSTSSVFSVSVMFKGPQLQKKVNQSYGFCVLQVV